MTRHSILKYLYPLLQEEVHPAAKVARAQLPADPVQRWQTVIPVIEDLKAKAKKLGLWNLFLSKSHYPEHGMPLSNLEVRVISVLVENAFADFVGSGIVHSMV